MVIKTPFSCYQNITQNCFALWILAPTYIGLLCAVQTDQKYYLKYLAFTVLGNCLYLQALYDSRLQCGVFQVRPFSENYTLSAILVTHPRRDTVWSGLLRLLYTNWTIRNQTRVIAEFYYHTLSVYDLQLYFATLNQHANQAKIYHRRKLNLLENEIYGVSYECNDWC